MADTRFAPALAEPTSAAKAERRNPLSDSMEWLNSVPAAARCTAVPYLQMFSLRCEADADVASAFAKALGVTKLPGANRFESHGDVVVCWIGPDEWLVVGPDGDSSLLTWLEEALGDGFGVVADVSGQRTTIDIQGKHARDLLAHGCARDLDVAEVGDSFTTVLALADVTLLVIGEDSYRILVRSSFASYLAEWLADASLEYQSNPDWA